MSFTDRVLQLLADHPEGLRQDHPDDEVAPAVPDVPTYRSLVRTIETTLATMRVSVFFVRDDGSVEPRWA
ncbi:MULTISPECIES: hypothetical protein [Saccharothrix]|uniref:hypothetical protein n=1 Tax=Saccharothrix TaxID=2071 RepID=UPI00093DAE1F|nr:hypothetical protein [Saccharothrix sp. CB00851]OKI30347.1 hypothetical protein A6A25_29255 [Saccharothrix sp. CB00851]